MIRFLVLIALVLVAAIAGLAFVPLATALKVSGAASNGVTWTAASGTVLHGRLEGLGVNGTIYGDADLKLIPGALLGGALQYSIGWTGPHGDGTAKVSVGSGRTVRLSNYKITLDLADYKQAAAWIRQSGGQVTLEGTLIQFRGSECTEAMGTASSDVLDLNSKALGAGWSDLSGDISCDGGKLLVPLESENADGTRFSAYMRIAPGSPGNVEARISGRISRALSFALPLAGFTRDGDTFVYKPSKKVASPAAAP